MAYKRKKDPGGWSSIPRIDSQSLKSWTSKHRVENNILETLDDVPVIIWRRATKKCHFKVAFNLGKILRNEDPEWEKRVLLEMQKS